jgi:hypothetical protein
LINYNALPDAQCVLDDDIPDVSSAILVKLNSQQLLTALELDFIALYPREFSCDGCGDLKNPLQDLGDFKVCEDCVNWAVLSVAPQHYYQECA